MKLFIVRKGVDPRLAELKIGGCSLEGHLSLNAAASFSVVLLEESSQSTEAGLYVRADVWFSSVALRRLAGRIADNEVRPNSIVATSTREVIAAYVDDPRELFAEFGAAPTVKAFGQGWFRLPNVSTFDTVELDREFPPTRIANFLDVARLEKRISYERACSALLFGVRIRDPDRISIRGELICGVGVEIDLDVIVEGRVMLEDGVRVGAGCILIDSTIGRDSTINPHSVIDHADIGGNSVIGPFGRVRPGSKIGDGVQIGNFVEIKASHIGAGSRINHLAFIGDAKLGAKVTIGAGVITCNHSPHGVRATEIGSGAYVGSGTELVAPLSIGENATIGAGSTITENVPAGKLTVARSRQVTIENWPRRDSGDRQD